MNFSTATKGLALGDIYSRQNGVHRLALISQRRLRRYEQLDYFSNINNITTRPEPYVHGFAPEILGLNPSDDVEWFYFAREVVKAKQSFSLAWQELAKDSQNIRARLGTKAALRNLLQGLHAPASGHDNPHYFDNLAMIRALGIVSGFEGSESELVTLVEEDASHTHSEDGVWIAAATSILAYNLSLKKKIEEAITRAIDYLPKDSWSYREINRALAMTESVSQINERVYLLERDYVDRIYPYPYAAPETFGLLCSHLLHSPEPELMFASVFQHRRHTDSLPVFIGYFMGLQHGDSWIPKSFSDRSLILEGVSIPTLKGRSLI
jgi:ADP-ribosylglycohydrolase